MKLTPERLRLAYEFLSGCPPFDDWNLPEGEDVIFRRTHRADSRGTYSCYLRGPNKGKHIIALNPIHTATVGRMMAVMAHEMIHLHERETEMNTRAQHSKAFMILAARVCKICGFDPGTFIWG